MKTYFNGTGAISPQKTFNTGFPFEIISHEQTDHLKCIEPIYKEYIDPMVSRRMSRLIKSGFTAAKFSLKEAGVENPDAIIVGTGMGCIEDTEKFLSSMITNNEQLLNPTPFIQSTHNTVGGQIALMLKCHNYNFTYVHRGFSFESALMDAMMMINEKSAAYILVGGSDELTENFYILQKRLGHIKRHTVSTSQLFNSNTSGSIAGEGSTFFVLGNQKTEKTYAELKAIETCYKPESPEEIKSRIIIFLSKQKMSVEDVDLVLYGINGDKSQDAIYHLVQETLFKTNGSAYFKHLCGEYQTATAFACWLAIHIIKHQLIPNDVKLNLNPVKNIKNILIYNHYRTIDHSIILISQC